jgi:fructose-bisphosphate aldolase class II
MHGGTGLSDEQFRSAIAAGISKINYATAIMNASAENMRQAAAKPEASMFDISAGITRAYSEWSSRLYGIFGTAGRV